QRPVACGQGARKGRARSRGGLCGEKNIKSFFEPALQEMGVTRERNQRAGSRARARGDVKAMNGIQEKQSPHALVEIVAAAPEAVERLAFAPQVLQCRSPAQ